ncbi:DUF4097 family beta strand repeat-containing protein [Actinomadura harenae]|uniref:DUF4097 domain-containing protein n=1 Tax=Actinomadura harenae TaxID=2483351 RepID=A0A3M2LQM8_9ACTN|nr:DUF4097 family beta strand repeat-containing protein [Actinomadura harenae]RMI39697.1 hypothetical protein EBO15_28895 [Actinomadura harenae]
MQKFDTAAPIALVLDVPAGRVRIIAVEQDETTVVVLPANDSKGRDVKAAEQTTVEFADGVLRIGAATAGNQYFGSSGSVEVTVQLPAGSTVEAKSGSAELVTTGRLGDVAFEGAYREIKLDEVAGLRLKAVDGDVEVGRMSGSGEISTSRGDITVGEAQGGKVVLATQTGDITVGAAAGVSASLDAGAGNGRVTNSLKNDGTVALEIHATTPNGAITARSL